MAQQKQTLKKSTNIKDTVYGLPYVINLTVIHYIYSHIQTADRFIEEKPAGKKAKHIPLFPEVIPISHKRFFYMRYGYNFQMRTDDIQNIIGLFGIDIRYFRKDNPMPFDIGGNVSLTDWKCYFNSINETKPFDLSGSMRGSPEKNTERVLKALNGLVRKEWNEAEDRDDPLFAVYYYFRYGIKYERVHRTVRCMELLNGIGYGEWEKESLPTLERAAALFKNHYDYIQALITINSLK